MSFPLMNGTLIRDDLTYILIYVNDITSQWFSWFLVFSFFFTVFIASLFAQFRFSTRVRPDASFLASSLATLAWTVVLSQKEGLINGYLFLIVILLNILAFIWISVSDR